jgi:integrase
LSFEFCTSTLENQDKITFTFGSEFGQFAFGDVRALRKANKPTRKEVKQLWPEAKEELEYFGCYLPKQRLIKALGILSDARKRRFLRRRMPKYGAINKGFTDEELVRFLNAVEDPRMALIFTFQAVLGLRIGEVVKLHIRDINLETRELKIGNEKGNRTDCLPIPPQLFEQTLKFISDYEADISRAKGHLFWAENYPERNSCPYLSKNFARNVFRRTIKKLKLDESYGLSDGQNPKLLHRLTTHSLRHYAITNFSKKNNGNVVLTSRFARHHKIETTMTYIHTEKEELYRSISMAQEGGILEKVKKIQKNYSD